MSLRPWLRRVKAVPLRRWTALALLLGELLTGLVEWWAGLRPTPIPAAAEMLRGSALAETSAALAMLAWGRAGWPFRILVELAPFVLAGVGLGAGLRAIVTGAPLEPSAASCFALLAASASFWLQRPLDDRRTTSGQVLACGPLLAGSLGLLALASHVGGEGAVARLVPSSPVHGPFLVLMGLGLWTLSPGRGLLAWLGSRTTAGRMTRRILPAVVVTPVVVTLGVRAGLDRDWWGAGVAMVLLAGGAIVVPVLASFAVGTRLYRSERAREAAANALRDREARLRVLTDGIPDHAVALLDAEGRFVVWTVGAARLSGYYPAQARNRPFAWVFGEDERRAGIPEHLLDEARRVGRATHDGWAVRRDGGRFWRSFTITPLDAGTHAAFVLVVRDRTAERLAAELGRRAERQLEQHRQLEAALHFRGRFLELVAHELHGPLEALSGFAELARAHAGPDPDPELLAALGRIRGVGGHLLRLVADLLDSARVDAGRAEFRPEPVQLAEALAEAVDLVRPTATARGQAIQVEHPVDPPRVHVDRVRLRQAVANYLTNAMRVTPPGGTVRVRARREDEATFRVEVEDQGPGLSPEQATQLFREWHQAADPTLRGRYGLGLALTRRLAEAQGGRVGVDRAPSGGSVFWVVLPDRAAEAEAASVFRTIPPSAAWGTGDG